MLANFFGLLRKKKQLRRTPRPRQLAPQLETLERRDAPAATIVDFQDLALAPNTYFNGSNNSGGFTSRGAQFNNSYDQSFGSWSGWSYSDVNNNTTAGYTNQYAAYTGTGVGGSGNYGVGCCSDPAFGGVLPTITIPDGMQVQSALFTNTTYAALSMLNGDMFAKKFGPNDWFDLSITGEDASNHVVGTVDFFLAQNGSIVNTWQSVNLGSLAGAKTLQFGLTSSDVGSFGMNTPAFFAMDNLTLVPKGTTLVDFEDLALAPNSYFNGSNNSGGFTSRGAQFNNSYDQTFGSWSGWSYSNVNDISTAGYNNQYAAYTGTGAGGSGNYGVGCCSDPAFGGVLPTITIPDGMQVQSALFTNTTYAALSMLNGDMFAKKFGPNDWFDLTITGEDASNHVVGKVDFFLAQNGSIVNTWQSVNLGSLAAARTLQFGLTSSDVGAFGMNTPAFFAMDNLTLVPIIGATTTSVSGNPSTVVYGSSLTLNATVTAIGGLAAPAAGSVAFKDATTGKDLGVGSFVVGGGTSSSATLTITASNANLFKVSAADTIVATYTAGAWLCREHRHYQRGHHAEGDHGDGGAEHQVL